MPQFEMTGIIRKLRRLSEMRPREMAHRFCDKGYAELERLGVGLRDPEVLAGLTFKGYLTGPASRRFYCGPRQNLRETIADQFPQWIDRAVKDADALCRHEIELLGYGKIRLGATINWNRDPISGRLWEKRFWTAYNPEFDNDGRDPKVIHELNRQQHLPRLAKAWYFTGDERYAEEAVEQIIGWIEQNPVGRTINWQSSLEIAIRSMSWIWALFLLLRSRALTEARAQRIGDSLFVQLEHIYRHNSRFSSPNTHLIGEAAALFIGGILFQDGHRPAAWLELGSSLLTQEAERQVLDDGAHAELSAYYHCYTVDFYFQVLLLAEQNGYPLAPIVRQRVGSMLEFLMHMTRPDGTLPGWGDCDGGRALALQERDYRSPRRLLCLGALAFLRTDFRHQAGEFSEDAFWFFGKDSWRIYSLLKSIPPNQSQSVHHAAGYAIQRSGWGPLDSHLTFDFGGLGMLTGGHAHADSLSIGLFSEGRELLTDPGTFVYNCAPEWRKYARSTRAHNTVVVDGCDQAEMRGTFSWKTRITARGSASPGYIEGEHDGYARLGIIHRRRVIDIPGDYWIIVDDLRGTGHHTFDFCYHFGPDVRMSQCGLDSDGVTVKDESGKFSLGVYASSPLTPELFRGQSQPLEGWLSRGYGDRIPSQSLRARAIAGAPLTALTFLSARHEGRTFSRFDAGDAATVACSSRHGGWEDLAIASTGDCTISIGDLRLCGEFFWIRKENGVVKQTLAIGATRFECAGKEAPEGELCAQFAEL